MNRIFLFIMMPIITGCAGLPQKPVDVMIIPNDCANQHSITAWLDQVSQQPKSALQSVRDYETNVSNIKARMWLLRYNCNRVR
jgi:hypothetical protein